MKDKEKADLIKSLISDVAQGRQAELLEEMVETVLRFGRDGAGIADLKLYSRAMRELRYATSVFSKYHGIRKVAVFGSARTKRDAQEYQLAREFAHRIVQHGYMIITGGGDGIMGAAQEGAGAEKSFGLNIRLPFEQRANEVIDGDPKLISFRYFFTRKLHFVKETHAFVLFPGGFGTHDEGFEVLTLMQTGKSAIVPIVFVDRPNGHYWETWRRFVSLDLLQQGLISPSDLNLFKITHSIEEAEAEILQFYKNFHSYRWVREAMVIRIRHHLTDSALEKLNRDFAYLLVDGAITQGPALPEEAAEVQLADLPRIVLTPTKHDFGGIRALIDAINASETLE
ncbi:MAG: Rossman fold protein, TIGR00730 family [Verrucomicrobia bacterium 61-8]|nr:TIGR00730 family Rossman fold protein [Verrucomicrobiota bacterium]OJV06092.1 MAG: Rossman fold protein, TIGR00730 family [Verrucomicrobia bacterium 61-8]